MPGDVAKLATDNYTFAPVVIEQIIADEDNDSFWVYGYFEDDGGGFSQYSDYEDEWIV